MTKQELIEKMAKDVDISKAAAGKELDSFIEVTTQLLWALALSRYKRAARTGRNPQTG